MLSVGVKGMLDKIGTEINSFAKMYPVESSLANFTNFINNGQKKIESYYPQMDQIDFYRFVLMCHCRNQPNYLSQANFIYLDLKLKYHLMI